MGKNVGDVQLEDFDYHLPEEAIAQTPVEPRDAARLLVDGGPGRQPDHRVVADLPSLVRPGDAIVINTTRVLPARLRLQKATGGTVEILLLEPAADSADNTAPPDTWEALVRPGRRVAPGTALTAGGGLVVTVGGPGSGDGTRRVTLQMPTGLDPMEALARYGLVPLPPYIVTPLADPERYQTVYAERPESVAAPTAGLHLTAGVLDACRAAGADIVPLELAVGLGTFRPIAAPRVEDHRLHPERYRIPSTTLDACRSARRVVAIGTTVVRALEASAIGGELAGRTGLFIHRPFDWQVVDVLLTNFHLPRSSLLVLLDAFMGPRWRDLYGIALMKGYRFLSFGDAMLVSRGDGLSELRAERAPGKPSSGGAV